MLLDDTVPSDKAMYCKHIATVVGLQDTASISEKVWVLNADTHMNEKGELVPVRLSPYMWMGNLLTDHQLLQCALPLHSSASKVDPETLNDNVITNLLKSLSSVYQHNFPATLLVLGAGLLCTHYEAVFGVAGQVPAAVVFGNISHGKWLATEAYLGLLGVNQANKVKSITDKEDYKLSSRMTLGIVIDDPSSPAELGEKLLSHFQRGERATCSSRHIHRCTFITSVNQECLDGLARMHPR